MVHQFSLYNGLLTSTQGVDAVEATPQGARDFQVTLAEVERLTQLDFGELAQLDSRATEAAFAEQAWHELHSGEDIVMPRSTNP